MSTDARRYRFGEYTLDGSEHRLYHRSADIPLRPKAFDTLLYLVGRHGHTVGKDELLDAVWPGTFVSDAVLTHCVAEVRRALQDDPTSSRYIRTLPKVGYAFVGEVEDLGDGRRASTTPSPFLNAAPEALPASTIAVLPFVNLSPDPENEYFCDGLSEELINGLTRLPGLRVVAHSSSFAFKGRDTDVREIGRQLAVGSVLEGSVRKSGEQVRISAQLIDTANGFHRWCAQYDRELDDVFALQDEIARAVLAALEVEILAPVRQPVIRPSTVSIDAYLLYLQGRSFWHRRYEGYLQRAMACFEQAFQQDPAFAPAHCGLADCYGTLGIWGFAPPHEAFPRLAGLARRALELQPGIPDAHTSLAMMHMFYTWDWAAAERELERALALNPGSAVNHLLAGHFLSIVGRFDESIAEVLESQALDPLSPVVGPNVGWTFHLAGRHGRAREELERVLLRFPGNLMAHLYLGYVFAAVGRFDDAIGSLRLAADTSGGMPLAAESVGWAQGLAGAHDAARRALSESLARAAASYVPTSAIALMHLGLGDDAALFACLDRCVEEHDAMLAWLKFMPAFDRVRPDPRFQAVLAKIGLA
jgi:TolB-like protein/Flp pilus assembly protein TadD